MGKTAKRTVGKPKREFSDAQLREMKELAFAGCQTGTIASIMDISEDTLHSRKDIQGFLTKARAERKFNLLQHQNKAAGKGNPALLIFLGKNILDQTDKHEQILDVKGTLADFLKGMTNG